MPVALLMNPTPLIASVCLLHMPQTSAVTQSISLSDLHKDSIPQVTATAGLNPGVSKH